MNTNIQKEEMVTLEKVNDQHFSRVWEMMKETYQNERHFNQLETQYRILASQWLLASFAGMGFIMTNNTQLEFDRLWLIVIICVISSLGIYKIWHIDVMVYQRLLDEFFIAGMKLETEHDFLPNIKNEMLKSLENKPVTKVLTQFYYIGISILIVIGFFVSGYLFCQNTLQSRLVILSVISLFLILVLRHLWIHMSKTMEEKGKRFKEYQAWVDKTKAANG